MLYYIWVMKMASRYKFSEEQIKEIEQARKGNKDKRAEARLKALELRAKGADASEVSKQRGFTQIQCHDWLRNIGTTELKRFPAITTAGTTAICV